MLSKARLIDQFRALGLRGGMDLMVHSSLRRLGKVSGGADAVLDAMIEILGPDGTLILPTHTWATVTRDQPVYHVRHTPSCVGALTEVFRKRDGVIRSLHPTHSVAAIGARAQQYTRGQLDVESPCPADSAYGRICANDGHILLLGVTMMNNTTLHYIEEEASLGGLYYDEKRTLVVIDADGAEHHLEIRPHRDDFREYKYWLDMEIPLHEAGILRFGRTGRGFSRLIAAGPFRRYMLRILRQSPEMLYKPGPWEDDDA